MEMKGLIPVHDGRFNALIPHQNSGETNDNTNHEHDERGPTRLGDDMGQDGLPKQRTYKPHKEHVARITINELTKRYIDTEGRCTCKQNHKGRGGGRNFGQHAQFEHQWTFHYNPLIKLLSERKENSVQR